MEEKLKTPVRVLVLFVIVYTYHVFVGQFLSGWAGFVVIIILSFVTWLLFSRTVFPMEDR